MKLPPTSVFLPVTGLLTNGVEFLDLFDRFIVKGNDVLASDVCSSVAFLEKQVVAYNRQAVEDCLFPSIPLV